MKLMLIFGPQAVGKMTVGEEVAARTGMKLFHNHMTIELVSHFFSYGTETGKRLVHAFREQIFDAVAQSDLEGLIFTYLWAFDMQGDWDAIERVVKKFGDRGAEIYYVELEATLDERLAPQPHRAPASGKAHQAQRRMVGKRPSENRGEPPPELPPRRNPVRKLPPPR